MSRVHLKGTISGQGHGCELKATEERRAEGVRVEPWLTFDVQPNKHPQQSPMVVKGLRAAFSLENVLLMST